MSVSTTKVSLAERSYDILIGPGLLGDPSSFGGLPRSSRALIVTNDTVGPLYAGRLADTLANQHEVLLQCQLPDGESYKNLTHLDLVFTALLEGQADRKTLIYALGGGVVGDMAGFAAACYMRGVSFVQIPTTLLAQVDSSVGGKTAVNHALGKNMIGAFHQPLRVLCDTDLLTTLGEREYRSGLAEVIKYGAMADPSFLAWLEDTMPRLIGRDSQALQHAVKRSCEIKAEVVGADEREAGLRANLNFGHTFGHAIETRMGYGTWSHGEAVATGMCIAASLSALLGLLPQEDADRLQHLIAQAGLPIYGPPMAAAEYLHHMAVDKKAESGEIKYVLLSSLGQAVVRGAPAEAVVEVLRRYGAT